MKTWSFGVKHEQLQHGEQPCTAAGYGRSFSHKAVLKGQAFNILSMVGNPVICVMCSELSLGHLQCTDSIACSCLNFFNKCLAHGVICKLCGCFVNRWRAGFYSQHRSGHPLTQIV
jgi:hypothetical protein